MTTIPPDGYTVPFYIAPVHGIHGGLRGRRRPFARLELRAVHNRIAKGKTDAEIDAIQSAELLAKVAEWSLAEPVSAEAIAALEYNLFERLSAIVLHTAASDVDPDAPEDERDPIRIEEERLKNCPAG